MLIPTKLQEYILKSIEINTDFISLTQKDKQKLFIRLIELWFFIYQKQQDDDHIDKLSYYTNIHNKELKQFRLRIDKQVLEVNKLLNLLEKKKTISINNKYSTGKFTKGYKIETDFIGVDYIEVDLDINKIFAKTKDKSFWLKKYPELKKQINDIYRTKIDLTEYVKWLRNNIGKELKPKMVNGKLKRRFLTNDKIFDNINQALKINFENIWVKLSEEGRLYSSITNLSSTAKDFIKLKRRSLKEVDVVNCQPLLLNCLIDHKKFKEDCEAGLFYDILAQQMNVHRDTIKVMTYKYLFFTNKPLLSGKLYECIEKEYNGLISQINELRTKIDIPKELQRIESNIFVKGLNCLDTSFLTIHDSVLCYDEYLDDVKMEIENQFDKLKLKVKLK